MLLIKQMVKLLALVLCTTLIAGCSSPEAEKQAYYNSALKYIEQDKQEAAILELRNAIQLDPKFEEARYQLGLLYLKNGQAQKAFAELLRSADLNPDNLDANLKVAHFLLLSHKKEQSRKRIESILEKDPNHRQALALLANLEIIEENFIEALATLERIGDEVESSGELQNIKGRIYAAQKQWDDAETAFLKAISIDGTNFTNYKILLHLYKNKKEKEKTKNLLDEMILKFPESTEAHLLLAEYYRSVGEREQVVNELQKVIDIEPESSQYRIHLANFYVQIGKTDSATQTLMKARSDIPGNPDITARLATLHFNQRRFDDARVLLDDLNNTSPGHGGTKLLEARFLQVDGKVRDSLAILQSLNSDFPLWSDPFFYLGLAHYSLGEIDLAQHAVASAIQKNQTNSKYHTLMAELFLVQGDYEAAKKEAAIALRLNSKNLRSSIILSRALIGAKQYDEAVAILTDIKRQVPANTEILGNLAFASLGAGEREKGEDTLNELLAIDPGNSQAIAMLIGLRYRDDLAGAETFVRQQIANAPDEHRLYLILGNLLEKQQKDHESLAAYEKAKELNPDISQPYLAAANLLRKLGKTDEAMAKYNAMIARQPDSIPGHMGIATLLDAEGSTSKAMEKYKEILEIKENYAPAANNLAWLIASDPDGDLGKALLLAMIAKQASPDTPHISDTLGWVHYRRKSYPLAIAQFELALQSRPDDPMITYHLALAQSANDQKEDALKTITELLERDVDFSDRANAEKLQIELQNNET